MVTAFPGHNAVDHQIVEDLGHGPVLVASECPRCGLVRYPPRELCPDDLTVMRTIPLSGPGTLHQAVRVDLAQHREIFLAVAVSHGFKQAVAHHAGNQQNAGCANAGDRNSRQKQPNPRKLAIFPGRANNE